jgi:hypothetical protein
MRQLNGSGGMERRGLIFKMITSLKQICNHPVQYAKIGKVAKELSGKAEKTISLLENILNLREKALIFTQYKEMGELLLQLIKNELKEDALFFHGGVQRAKRDKMVADFQENIRNKIMVVSLKAGDITIDDKRIVIEGLESGTEYELSFLTGTSVVDNSPAHNTLVPYQVTITTGRAEFRPLTVPEDTVIKFPKLHN